jgi:DNA (cytosine-5)-methyltransferase 1
VRKLKVLDLFSGIGGFSLGLERTGGFETVAFCEINNFCQRVLKKHWPKVFIHSDITKLGAHHFDGYARPDLICGGFPCQDISVAGKQAGLNGERSKLWWEMYRIICELRPRWVLVENVPKLRVNGADQILSSLEQEGYNCWPTVVGAWAAGCKHNRDRVWILCHSYSSYAVRTAVGRKPLLPAKEWSLEKAEQERIERFDELVPGDRVSGVDAYAGIVRAANGIPDRVDRLTALGNAVVPDIPELFGRFILHVESTLQQLETIQ